MTVLTLWHGSFTPNIQRFRALSHFGSKLQAYRVIAAHGALDKEQDDPVLYECDLSISANEILHLDDFGSPYPQAVFRAYCDAIDKYSTFQQRYREAMTLNLTNDAPEWQKWINELASANGHKLLSYDNEVEGDGLSYCLLDKTIIKNLTSTSLTWNQVSAFDHKYSAISHGFSDEDINKIETFLDSKGKL
jgi:hypothetical protein